MKKPVAIDLEICKKVKCKYFSDSCTKDIIDNGYCLGRFNGCPVPKDCEFYNVHLSTGRLLKSICTTKKDHRNFGDVCPYVKIILEYK